MQNLRDRAARKVPSRDDRRTTTNTFVSEAGRVANKAHSILLGAIVENNRGAPGSILPPRNFDQRYWLAREIVVHLGASIARVLTAWLLTRALISTMLA